MPKTSPSTTRRDKLRKRLWPGEDAWTGSKDEVGWVKLPRTFPLILRLLASKELSGIQDPRSTYLELWSRQIDGGIIEMSQELDHAYAAGYSSNRIRTWKERMKLLEDLGFIKTKPAAGVQYRYVLLVHPTVAVQRLRDQNRIDDEWWTTYVARQGDTKEATYEEREAKRSGKLVDIRSADDVDDNLESNELEGETRKKSRLA